jgi:molybdopterin-synthase adenylyltransferase
MLTPDQRARYERNLLIPGIGESGQEKLAKARVCVIGLGGLGSPAAYYLAAAGVGTVGLVDSDVVDVSNLQRQILHTTDRIGMSKAESAELTLNALNPEVRTQAIHLWLSQDNVADVITQFDVVVEATDNFETKFLINDACLEYRKPFATAGILGLSGQALFVAPGESPCLRCAVPSEPEGVPTTSDMGVLGAVPGILGSLQALETIRYLAGLWAPQDNGAGLLNTIDGDAMRLRTMHIPRRPECRCASLRSTTS